MRPERTDEPLQASCALGALVAAGEEQPVAVDGDVLDDSLAAIVRDRFRVDVGETVTAIERRRFSGAVPCTADAGADKHQITLLRREHRIIPIHDGQRSAAVNEDIAGVEVAVAGNVRQVPLAE